MSAAEFSAGSRVTIGLRRAGWALTAIALAALAWLILVRSTSESPSALLAVAGMIALGIVFIAVSLAAHVYEGRDRAEIYALLQRAEKENYAASSLADEVAAELDIETNHKGTSAAE